MMPVMIKQPGKTLRWFITAVALTSAAMVAGCYHPIRSGADPADGSHGVFSRILVLPFQNMAAVFGEDQAVRGPLSGKVFVSGSVAPQGVQFLTAQATRKLARRLGDDSVLAATGSDPGLDTPLVAQSADLVDNFMGVGRRYGADAVLVGFVYGFGQRVGGDYGVETPAQISFELNLIRVSDGRLAWQRHHTESQQPLNENLLKIGRFLQRKGRWVTAEEMADQALDEMLVTTGVFRRQENLD